MLSFVMLNVVAPIFPFFNLYSQAQVEYSVLFLASKVISYPGGPTLTGLTCKYWTRLTSLAKDNTIVYLFDETVMKKKKV